MNESYVYRDRFCSPALTKLTVLGLDRQGYATADEAGGVEVGT